MSEKGPGFFQAPPLKGHSRCCHEKRPAKGHRRRAIRESGTQRHRGEDGLRTWASFLTPERGRDRGVPRTISRFGSWVDHGTVLHSRKKLVCERPADPASGRLRSCDRCLRAPLGRPLVAGWLLRAGRIFHAVPAESHPRQETRNAFAEFQESSDVCRAGRARCR